MINFEWYRTFKAIYRKGTLTGAAQELFISQPNVGQHLAALEAHIGKELFLREHRKMVPTDYGKLLYAQLIEAVEKLEQVEAHFKYNSKADFPILFIGTVSEFFNAVMADQVGKWDSNLVFEYGTVEELTDRLLNDRLSFAFTSIHIAHRNLTSEPVFKESFLLVGRSDTDTSEFDKMVKNDDLVGAEQWLLDLTWLAYSNNLLIIRRFWLNNFKKRPAIQPRYVIPGFEGILKTIVNSGGVTIAPDYMLDNFLANGQLKVIWQGVAPSQNSIHLTYNPKKVTLQQVERVKSLANKL
jgi:DNA-binding transcriptional LysR family regulator